MAINRTFKIILLFLTLISSFCAYSAAPITHVILGEKWLTIYAPQYTEEEKKQFLLGTVFPDIRYLGVIDKSKTHFKGITLDKVNQAKTPFQRGMLFHSFVDEFRNTLVHKSKIYKTIKEIPSQYQDTFLKLIEDQILYSRMNWAQFMSFLGSVPEEEKQFNIDTQALIEWHTGLTMYFSLSPGTLLTQFSFIDKKVFLLDPPAVKLWSTLLPVYAAKPEMKAHVENMLKAFDEKLKK